MPSLSFQMDFLSWRILLFYIDVTKYCSNMGTSEFMMHACIEDEEKNAFFQWKIFFKSH